MKIIGLRIEKYVGEGVSRRGYSDTYPMDKQRHILYARLDVGTKVRITLETQEELSIAGVTAARYAKMFVEKVSRFEGYTYIPVKPLIVPDILPLDDTKRSPVDNKVFKYSFDGDDHYYPWGFYSVSMDLFRETVRHKSKRPVWVFIGPSNSGKSFLGHKLSEMTVYETDSNATLPEVISADVIVLGNKYEFTVEEISGRIFGEHELCVVQFSPQ